MAATNGALATIEIDELVPTVINGAVLYYRAISIEQIEPEWEIELA